MTEVTNAEGTANKKELSLLRILSAYIKIIIYLSIALSFVNLIQRWGQWSYILPTIGGLLIHMFFYFVVYHWIALICTKIIYNNRLFLKPENEKFRKNRGKRLAAKICLAEPALCICYAIANGNVRISLDTMLMAVVLYAIPLVFIRNFIRQINDTLPSEQAVINLRRKKGKITGQMVWFVKNTTSFHIEDEYIDNKYIGQAAFRHAKNYMYMLSTEELIKLYNRTVDELQIMKQTWRWCYVISEQDKDNLEKIFEKMYTAYTEAGNPGIRKILILNIVPNGVKVEVPKRYKRTEFIYYAQVSYAGKINYSLLANAVRDVYNRNGKGFAVATKKRKKKTSIERLFLLLRDVFRMRYFDGDRDYFHHPEQLLSRILDSGDIQYDFKGGDEWLMDFYSSACVFETPERSTMAMLDYWELTLRMVAIYYYKRANSENISEETLVHANFMELARIIQRNSYVEPKHYEKLTRKKYYVAELIGGYIEYIDDKIYIDFKGTEVSFLGLTSLILTIRNKIVAHGIMNQKNCACVWGIVYWATLLLNNYLNTAEFQLEENNGQYEIGYEEKISASPLVIDKDGMPCIASLQKSNKKKSYIYVNYFSGELISPEFI